MSRKPVASAAIFAPSRVLYRKYRPTSLDAVVGQEQITSTLANSIKQGKIAHAYLFIGPRGTGKTSVARIFAHAINDFPYTVEDSYLDIIEIDAASNTGVDNIRELREKAVIAPSKGKYKVYIIDEVHMLTKSASNALLKTLEEPPAHVIFIMATTDAHKVPITISSRTQVHTFRLADSETMFQHLRKISDAENIPIDDDALKIIVRRGGGSFRDSLSLLDQISTLSDGPITAPILTNALGLPQEQSLETILSAYAQKDTPTVQDTLKDLLNTGLKPETIASDLISRIIAQPNPEILPLLSSLPAVQPPFPEAKLLLALLDCGSSEAAPSTSGAKNAVSTPIIQAQKAPKPSPQAPIPAQQPVEAPESPEETAPEKAPSDQALAETAPKATSSAPQSNSADFDWSNFCESIRSESTAVYSQLQKVEHEFDGHTLHLYPEQKFTKTILEKSSHIQLMADFLSGIELVVHAVGENRGPKDPTLSQVSAIMGDIREIEGDMPF